MSSESELITNFLEESLDSLTALDEKIIALEQTSDIEKDVNEIFRPAHSIKGAASFFKLTGLMEMAHKLETLLDQLRKFEREISKDIVDTLSRGFFLLRGMVERGLEGDFEPSASDSEFIEELEGLISGGSSKSVEDSIAAIIEKVSEGALGDPVQIVEELKKLLPEPEDTGGDLHPRLTEIEGEMKKLLDGTDADVVAKVKELVASLDSDLKDADAEDAADALNDFLGDFTVLVESPVGVDEMLYTVLEEKLQAVNEHIPDGFEKEEDEKEKEEKTVEEEKAEDTSKPAPKKAPKKDRGSGSIRVNVSLLEKIMNLVEELVLSRNQLNLRSSTLSDPDLIKTSQQISGITSELQERVMKTRLQPVSTVFDPLPGVVREIARNLEKEVELIIEGKDTELDRSILEGIKDPLTHVIRNSMDHGLETPAEREKAGKTEKATLIVRAYHEGGQVIIEIRDNGKGVNIERVREKALEKGLFSETELNRMGVNEIAAIIFHAGFSTAQQITQVSGRGVGMDVVRSNIENLGGLVELNTFPGEGTTLRFKIPLTLAIIPALIVEADGKRYALPQANLEEMVLLTNNDLNQIERIRDTEVYRLRGRILPLVRLNKILNIPFNPPEDGIHIIVLTAGKTSFGLIVERLYDMEEIVVKSLDEHIKQASFFSGATIMGDGTVALILDVMSLAQANNLSRITDNLPSQKLGLQKGPDNSNQIMLFNLSSEMIYGVPLDTVYRLETIKKCRIERMSGRLFLQYRGGILPLISCWDLLGVPVDLPEEIVIIVFRVQDKEAGLLVSSIEDVVRLEGVLNTELNSDPHILGSCILSGQIISLLDLYYIARTCLESLQPTLQGQTVVIWDESPVQRQIKARSLMAEGCDVTTVTTEQEALDALEWQEVDAIILPHGHEEERSHIQNEIKKLHGDKIPPIMQMGNGPVSEEEYKRQLHPGELMEGIEVLANPEE